MIDGRIDPDSAAGIEIGFTSDKFRGWLWKDRQRILISFVESKTPGIGNLSRLFKAIELIGLRVAVPSPLGRMKSILKRNGFSPHFEHDPNMMYTVEVWEKNVRPHH